MEEIIHYDKQLLLLLNGSDFVFLDWVVMTLTNAMTWIPLYMSLLYVVIKTNRNVREVLLILCAAGLCVLLAGTIEWRQLRIFLGSRFQYLLACPLLLVAHASATAYHRTCCMVVNQLLDTHVSGCPLSGRYHCRTNLGRTGR